MNKPPIISRRCPACDSESIRQEMGFSFGSTWRCKCGSTFAKPKEIPDPSYEECRNCDINGNVTIISKPSARPISVPCSLCGGSKYVRRRPKTSAEPVARPDKQEPKGQAAPQNVLDWLEKEYARVSNEAADEESQSEVRSSETRFPHNPNKGGNLCPCDECMSKRKTLGGYANCPECTESYDSGCRLCYGSRTINPTLAVSFSKQRVNVVKREQIHAPDCMCISCSAGRSGRLVSGKPKYLRRRRRWIRRLVQFLVVAVIAGGVYFALLTALNYQRKSDAGYDITVSESAMEVYQYNRAKFFEIRDSWLQ